MAACPRNKLNKQSNIKREFNFFFFHLFFQSNTKWEIKLLFKITLRDGAQLTTGIIWFCVRGIFFMHVHMLLQNPNKSIPLEEITQGKNLDFVKRRSIVKKARPFLFYYSSLPKCYLHLFGRYFQDLHATKQKTCW